MDLKIGCCGFPVTMDKYFKSLNFVEVQKTFYKPPALKTVRRWRAMAPEEFEFAVKAWHIITHDTPFPEYNARGRRTGKNGSKKHGFFRPTDEVFMAWEKTEEIASILGAGILVFECPGTFLPDKTNKTNLLGFFKKINRKKYIFVMEFNEAWSRNDVKSICGDAGLIPASDPFRHEIHQGSARYFKLNGMNGRESKYSGWDMKRLSDFCANEAKRMKDGNVYAVFGNSNMFKDAGRFNWISKNTGRIRESDLAFLKGLCDEIDKAEEDERVQLLSREADKIAMLILHTEYAKVDIDIEKEKLRGLCREIFPDKEYLYEMIYEKRFERLWEQFREKVD
ncbi:MAG: DUF72 domain-containing protein [Candidatus Omnitrophota bacterium]